VLLDPQRCYQALKTHDARFDGRFFVGVSSTGIYCRPVCSGRAPKPANCSFYPSAAAAEAAGYRPCLRCRPELAPGTVAVDANGRLAHAAAGLIEDDLLRQGGVSELAQRLSVSDRHVRRVFRAELGVTPAQFAQTQRLLLAKRLLTDTSLPITEVALASGFGSLRRLNALFRQRYRFSPTRLRKPGGAREAPEALELAVCFRPPLDWSALLAFLARRTVAGVEHVVDGVYLRTVRVEQDGTTHSGWIAATRVGDEAAVRIALSASLSRVIPLVLTRARRMFDLACDPEQVTAALGSLGARNPGLRLPGAYDGFEAAVRGILGQQVTVKSAHTLAGRLAAAFGEALVTPHPALRVAFPAPQRIAALDPTQIAALGVVRTRANAIVGVAREIAQGRLRLDPSADVGATLAALRAIPGIGEWTAQYIAMRALAWPDAFPHSDYGVLKALQETDPRQALRRAEAWRPWRAYAVMHLWQSGIRDQVSGISGVAKSPVIAPSLPQAGERE